MAKPKLPLFDDRPHVALLVETSLAPGRRIVRGITRYLRESSNPWLIYHEPCDLGSKVPIWLARWKGSGIIARLQNKRVAEAVRQTGLPAVDVLGVYRVAGIPLVHVDDTVIARVAAEHLLERGLTRFGCCVVRGVNWSQQRCDAFERIVSVLGHSCNVYRMRERNQGTASWEEEQEKLGQWARSLPKPAGVLAVSDLQGQRLLEACRRVGVRVPNELAVIGVNNDESICEVCAPPLTSVNPDITRVGYEAARLLDAMMQGKAAPKEPIYIRSINVALRTSTDVLAIDDAEVANAIGFIRKNACSGIGVDDVVRYTAVSRTSLKRRFHSILGRSVHDEIIAERLKQAQFLLTESNLSLKEIAKKTAFPSQDYMGTVFKAKTGKSPGQYRREAGE